MKKNIPTLNEGIAHIEQHGGFFKGHKNGVKWQEESEDTHAEELKGVSAEELVRAL